MNASKSLPRLDSTFAIESRNFTAPLKKWFRITALSALGFFGGNALEAAALSSGQLVQGEIETVGSSDSFTISASQGDTVIAEVGERFLQEGVGFYPSIRIVGPDSALLDSDQGTSEAEVEITAPLTGTFTIIIEDGTNSSPTSTGFYELKAAVIPDTYVVSAGDQGGPVVSGELYDGRITLGNFDIWTIEASINDRILAKIGERFLDETEGFYPFLKIYGPDGALLASDQNSSDAEVEITAPLSGIYTLIVEDGTNSSISSTGFYELKAAVISGPQTVSPGDQGGPVTSGELYDGRITLGNFDIWTIEAAQNDRILAKIGERFLDETEGFYPLLKIYGPDAALLRSDQNSSDAEVEITAALSGTYTIIVENGSNSSISSTGFYELKAAVISGPQTVSPGDQGGPVTSGKLYDGRITLGNFDIWTVEAAQNDRILAKIGERFLDETEGFYPLLKIYGPDAELLRSDQNSSDAEVEITAALTGTYTIIVENGSNSSISSTGFYELKTAVISGPQTVSAGDQGGPVVSGKPYDGHITLGNFDIWTVSASQNQRILAKIGERFLEETESFYPLLKIYGPGGDLLAFDQNSFDAEVEITAALSGTYTVVVENGSNSSLSSTGYYEFKTFVTGGAFAVGTSGEGAVLDGGGTFNGEITLGNFDLWSFDTSAGETIELTLTETSTTPEDFFPLLKIYRPDGTLLSTDQGGAEADIVITAPLSGTYTVVVENGSNSSATSTGTYQLEVSGTDIRAASTPALVADPEAWKIHIERDPTSGLLILSWDASAAAFCPVLLESETLLPGSFTPAGFDLLHDGSFAKASIDPSLADRRFFVLGLP